MANLIDTSYFINDIEVTNVAQAEVAVDLTASIVQYEKEVLIKLLGYPLYAELVAAPEVVGDKYYKLINGETFEFTLNGETISVYWEGLKGFNKKSLIAYYTYFMHRRKRASYMAGVGTEVKAASENSEEASLADKLIYIWNEFVDMYGDTYSEGQHTNADASAYNYLLAKTADFTNWKFKSQGGKINRFGI